MLRHAVAYIQVQSTVIFVANFIESRCKGADGTIRINGTTVILSKEYFIFYSKSSHLELKFYYCPIKTKRKNNVAPTELLLMGVIYFLP